MAKDEGAAVAPKNNKMMIIIIAVVVLVLVLGGGAAFLLMGGKSKKHGAQAEAPAEEEVADAHAKPISFGFEEKFTVNLQTDDGTSHYLQVPKIELELASENVAKKMPDIKSKISDRINSTLRSKTAKEMLEAGSDIKLKEELKKVINEALEVKPEDAEKKGVREVILPSSFIVQ